MKMKKSNLILIVAFVITVLSVIATAFYVRITLINSINEEEKIIRKEIIKDDSSDEIRNLKDSIEKDMPHVKE